MSEESVQVARQMIDAWNRGDIDEWASGLHEEVVWVPLTENPQTEPARGVEDVRQFVLDWVAPWDEYKIDISSIVDEGNWVVVGARHQAKHESGVRAAGIDQPSSG